MRLSRSALTRRGPLATLVVVPLLAVLTLFCWGLSSPSGSSPDDDFHLASIWCGEGSVAGQCVENTTAKTATVPRDLQDAARCYAFVPATSASCQGADFGTTPSDMVSTPRGNFDHSYPPVFYSVLGVFAGPNVDIAVLTMRAFNSVLFVALLTGLFLLLPRARRSTLVVSVIVTSVPLVLFLIPSTNPSSWAIMSAATVWISLLGYFETRGWRKAGLGVFTVIATVVGAGARADSALFVALSIGVVAVLVFSFERRVLLSALLPCALLLIAIGFYFASGQSAAASTGLDSRGSAPVDTKSLIAKSLLSVPELWVGVFGSAPLGWLDTNLPAVVWVASLGCFCGAVFVGLTARHRRKGIAAGIVLAMLWGFPTVLLVGARATVGEFVQARYVLPIVIILGGVCLLQRRGHSLSLSLNQAILVIGALSAAQSVALHVNMRRYITGSDVSDWNLDRRAEWWWNIPVSPMMVWILGSLAFAVLLSLVFLPAAVRSRRMFEYRPQRALPAEQPTSVV